MVSPLHLPRPANEYVPLIYMGFPLYSVNQAFRLGWKGDKLVPAVLGA